MRDVELEEQKHINREGRPAFGVQMIARVDKSSQRQRYLSSSFLLSFLLPTVGGLRPPNPPFPGGLRPPAPPRV